MSRTAKLGLAAVLGVIVVVALAFASVQSLAGDGPTSAASAFFKAIAEKGAAGAYATTSPTFQRATAPDAFVAAVQARGLGDAVSSDWTLRGQQGDLAELSGAVNLKGGGVVPADVRLVKGQSGWQVLSLELPQGGLAGAGAPAATQPTGGDANAVGGYDPSIQPGAAPSDPSSPAAAPQSGAQTAGQGGPAGLIAPPPGGQGYAPQYAGAPNPSAGQAPEVSGTRVARMCGKTLMRNSWAESVQLHCPTGIGAAPGSTTRCEALINGRRTGLTATMERYDTVRDDAQVSCRLD